MQHDHSFHETIELHGKRIPPDVTKLVSVLSRNPYFWIHKSDRLALAFFSITATLLPDSWVLDQLWTGTEPLEEIATVFNYRGDRKLHLLWDTLCALSRTSSRLRILCLPRLTGTLYFRKCEVIGKFWKAIQLNPSLGSFTHTCYFKFESRVRPFPLIPSQAIEKMFQEGAAESAIAEARRKSPENIDKIREIEFWAGDGPDGSGFDKNITSPEDWKQALIDIVSSWTRIRSLHWDTWQVPLLTEIIEHVESLGTLHLLAICIAACEERFYLFDALPASDRSRASNFEVGKDSDLSEELLNPQLEVLEKALQAAKTLDSLFLHLNYPDSSHSQARFQMFIRRALPVISCVPDLQLPESMCPLHRHVYAMQELHTELESLSNRKHRLEATDVRQLGKAATENGNHSLAPYANLLQEEELAENIVKEWNRRYAPA